MFFSEQEEKIIGNLFKDISEEPYKIYILEFNDGSILKAQMDTCYESDNGLEEDDEQYQEYYACAMEIIKVIKDTTPEKKYKERMLIEINY
ncbi:MAG: hypothetical protein HFH66_17985, partial [Lachnospiraceae bacterium]|nr:hypothetical protein [Lachnospiraceae bacterium]